MEIKVKTVEEVVVVELVGRIDGRTAREVQEQILPQIQPGGKIVLDMSLVTYMSSAGLRMLVAVHRQVSDNDGELALAGLNEKIRDTMSITGFLPYFDIHVTFEEAVAALK